MNWYKKIILAQGVEQYLRSLTQDEEVIQHIMSQGNNMQYLVNELKKNPGMNREQLEAFQFPQKEIVDPYIDYEKRIATQYAEPFQKWILVNARKIRMSKEVASENEKPLIHSYYMNFSDSISEIFDWYRNTNPDIFSYDASSAMDASDEWHRAAAGKGSGKIYEPTTQESIVYGPQWQNPEWQGWTVQKVMGKNDLAVEGNKMNHCIGEYCEDVESGFSIVYSLRDPQNNPHVTMETDDFGNIKQIQGNSNNEPNEQYKTMIKEWMTTTAVDLGIVTEINAFENLEEKQYGGSANILDFNETLSKILQSDEDEYGLKYILDTDLTSIAEDIIGQGEMDISRRFGIEDINDSPDYLVNLAMKEDLNMDQWPRHAGEWKEFRESPKESNWNNIREIKQWAFEQIDELREDSGFFPEEHLEQPMPEEENYTNPLEYQVAMKMYEGMISNIENEWLDNSVRGSFSKSILNEIDNYINQNIIPNTEELYAIDQKEAKKKKQQEFEKLKSNPEYHRGLE